MDAHPVNSGGEFANPDLKNWEFLVLIPKSAGDLGESAVKLFEIGGIWILRLVPNKTILLLGLQKMMLLVVLWFGNSSSVIRATPMPLKSKFSQECLVCGKTFGVSEENGFLGEKGSRIEVGLIRGSDSVILMLAHRSLLLIYSLHNSGTEQVRLLPETETGASNWPKWPQKEENKSSWGIELENVKSLLPPCLEATNKERVQSLKQE